ncbi:protein REVEILLE 6-like [Rhododendron vialii]|uniref:protein REVEILLE 6-like n=1 Tax=Rhododendron vialii TaxID=182163 RepID=UPI00265DD5C9|nr:protein REVEILLE 6-like [Rhododendron vialii]
MVSLSPNPPAQHFYMDPMKMGLPGLNSLPTSTSNNTASVVSGASNSDSDAVWELSEDPSKKIRKPYTITKSRESWTDQEHDKFLEALQLFDRDWKKIEAFVGSKTVIQIRSHAQKYFLKVQKSGKGEHVPPPRPKRKAAHPYPQKAAKNAPVASQVTGLFQSSSAVPDSRYVLRPDSLSHPENSISFAPSAYWTCNSGPSVNVSHITKDEVGVTSSSSNESTPKMCMNRETNYQGKGEVSKPVRVMPDFAKVYSFLGSVFDPNTCGHLQKLKSMDPINVETALLLMKNLSVNLTSPEFEDHKKMFSSYDADAEKAKSSFLGNNFHVCKPENAIASV